MPRFVLILILFLIAPTAAQTPDFVVVDCPFGVFAPEVEGETMYCAELTVPENRQTANPKMIQLAVVVLKSPNAPDAIPLVNLEGGPGGSATAAVDGWYSSALRQIGDIVLIDQRGTGRSVPSLNCSEFEDEGLFEDAVGDIMHVAETNCRERLESEGVDVAAYNTRESATDVADLVYAMGYDQVNLYGSSYGTRLGLAIMRDHPQIVRSAILDAVYPFGIDEFAEQTPNGDAAIQAIITACMQDTACNASYPDLLNVFYTAVSDLNNNPLDVYDYEFEEYYAFAGNDLVNTIFSTLYDTSQIGLIPHLIYMSYERDADGIADFGTELSEEESDVEDVFSPLSNLSDETVAILFMEYVEADSFEDADAYIAGLTDEEFEELIAFLEQDYVLREYLGLASFAELWAIVDPMSDEAYSELVDEAYGIIDSDSEGLFNSVHCRETIPFNSIDEINALAQTVDEPIRTALLSDVLMQFTSCEIWGVAVANPEEVTLTESDIPTLLLSGEFDPITPASWGEYAAQTLSRGYHYVMPGMGHGTVDIADCPTTIALNFLNDPMTEPDASCINEMGGVDFYLR